MTITGANGKAYDVRFTNDINFEIERHDDITGLPKVFVFQDLSIGHADSKRKETVFYSYDITPTGERINRKRHPFKDSDGEFEAFYNSEAWEYLKTQILTGFFKKIEFTEPLVPGGE